MELLGKTVRDSISGLTGIAQAFTVLINGNERYSVQPQGDGTKILDAYEIDEHVLSIVEDGPTVDVILPETKISAALGDRVRDLLTGREGIVHIVHTSINGCVYLGATEHVNGPKDQSILKDSMFFTHSRFEVIEPGAFAKIRAEADAKKKGLVERVKDAVTGKKDAPAHPVPPAQPARKPPGGPTTKSPRL